ncbi:MAG: signal recognition particle protein [Eubacteriaceae bacterium]|nr:signal recognition particle protein [Eubacteriaceae bacterium]
MFNSLGDKIQDTFKKLTGKGKLSEKDIDSALREIRMALLEADVNYKVVKSFLASVKERALGEEVLGSLTPGQMVIKIVHSALSELIGSTAKEITFSPQPPTVIMMAGVQGSGKTTSAGKLANYLKKKSRRILIAACDTQRAAAVSQIRILAEKIGVDVFHTEGEEPEVIASQALKHAKMHGYDVLIVDTAGRQHVDDDLMEQIGRIHDAVNPNEVFFVVDCMMGQQAVDAATAFNEKVNITGFILSKADSDARGGAALSVSYITGRPIKFAGTGEKITDFELFHPDRVASRILGMGDMMSFIEKASEVVDEEKSKKMAEKLVKNTFTLQDYLDQMEQMAQMGGMEELLGALPGAGKMKGLEVNQKEMNRTKAIIQSMTPKERNNPKIINASRKRRIAAGSGTTVTEVNRLLNGFEQSKKLIKQMSSQKRKFSKMKFPFM